MCDINLWMQDSINFTISYGGLMSIQKSFMLFVVLGVFIASGAEAITGRVVNTSSGALAYAKVWLKNNPDIIDSTDTNGLFSLVLPQTGTSSYSMPAVKAAASIINNSIVFSLNTVQKISIELFDMKGRLVSRVFKGTMGQGEHSIKLDRKALYLQRVFYTLRFSSSELSFESTVFSADNNLVAHTPKKSVAHNNSFSATAKITTDGDTLIVLRMGYEIKKTFVASLTSRDMGYISLKDRTYSKSATITVKTDRNIEVVLPSDYNELYSLPVLYLLHGGGADETYWRNNCKLIDTLNKFDGRLNMQPMIIIIPSCVSSSNYGYYGKTADPFYSDLVNDIRSYVESHYKADTTRYSRAISGLSMGAAQTWMLTLFYPGLWGYSFPMSGGIYHTDWGFSLSQFKSDVNSGAIDVAAINQIKILKVYTNSTDMAWSDVDSTCKYLDEVEINYLSDLTTQTTGGHTDVFWNEVFRKYSQTIFK
ncbi:MAG TPA: hypothetical protein DCO75_11020 [Fibrobacteres bacterium]|nr:hypothetical protein [Fibrobacterota bacterium]